MTDLEIKEKIKHLSEKYPHLEEIIIDYNGSGGSFDSMYSNQHDVDYQDYEDIVWELIERADSNFNNEGSSGQVIINLKDNTVKIEDYFNVVETVLNTEITI